MMKRFFVGIGLFTVAVLPAIWFSAAGARAVRPPSYISIAASTFVGREYSSHNRNGGADNACADFVPLTNGGENLGDLDNGKGSYFAPIRFPNGVTVRGLRLYVNDADMDTDAAAYLIRRKLEGGLPITEGYKVMARVRSADAVAATIRRFRTGNIEGAEVDNTKYEYYVELVDCGVPEPFAVQVLYR